jgi:hypothetical protein
VDQHYIALVDLIDPDSMDHVLYGLPASLARKLGALNGASTSEDLEAVIGAIPDKNKAELVRSCSYSYSKGISTERRRMWT